MVDVGTQKQSPSDQKPRQNITMTTTHDKQFTLYSHPEGANPWKVALILEELGLSYHTISFTDWGTIDSPFIFVPCLNIKSQTNY